MKSCQSHCFAFLIVSLCSFVACGGKSEFDAQFVAPADVRLGLSDPGLIEQVQTFVVAAYFLAELPTGQQGCSALVDGSYDLWTENKLALKAVQPLPKSDNANHTFGNLQEEGKYAMLVFGSTKANTDNDENFPRRRNPEESIGDAAGSIIAIGCQEVDVTFQSRTLTDVVLFPAGLR